MEGLSEGGLGLVGSLAEAPSGRRCLHSSHVADSQEGATAFIKGLSKIHLCLAILKVPAGPQGGLVPDPEAGSSCSPSALTPPRPVMRLPSPPIPPPRTG